MSRTHSVHARSDRGAAVVEFALISVVFLTLCFGMVQYSLYFWSGQSAANAAREGARRAAVGQTCAELGAATTGSVKLASTTPVVTRRYYAASDSSFSTPVVAAKGTNARITIAYNSLDLNIPLIPFIKNGTVSETSVSRVEYYDPATAVKWSNCS